MRKSQTVVIALAGMLLLSVGAAPAQAASGIDVVITASDGWAWNVTSDDPSPSSFNCKVSGTPADQIMKSAQAISQSSGKKLSSGRFRWIVDPTVAISPNPLYPAQSGKYRAHCALSASVPLPTRKAVNIVLVSPNGSKAGTIRSVRGSDGRVHVTYDKITGSSSSAGRL